MMNKNFFMLGRESYSYPPGKLVRAIRDEAEYLIGSMPVKPIFPHELEWRENRISFSSVDLDSYHTGLLNSEYLDDVVLGVCSVTYWGYLSGKNSRIHNSRSLIRAKWVVEGNSKLDGNDKNFIFHKLRSARDMVLKDKIGMALLEVLQLKHFGVSFASKILAFMDPSKCAVYDKIISNYINLSSNLNLGNIRLSNNYSTMPQAGLYERWCKYCTEVAVGLNGQPDSQWSDWDFKKMSWRAIDVERAYFSHAINSQSF